MSSRQKKCPPSGELKMYSGCSSQCRVLQEHTPQCHLPFEVLKFYVTEMLLVHIVIQSAIVGPQFSCMHHKHERFSVVTLSKVCSVVKFCSVLCEFGVKTCKHAVSIISSSRGSRIL